MHFIVESNQNQYLQKKPIRISRQLSVMIKGNIKKLKSNSLL